MYESTPPQREALARAIRNRGVIRDGNPTALGTARALVRNGYAQWVTRPTGHHWEAELTADGRAAALRLARAAAPMAVASDAALGTDLAAEVGAVRGEIRASAEGNALPAGFSASPADDGPAMVIYHQETGRTTRVPMFAYGAVRDALGDLFGEAS